MDGILETDVRIGDIYRIGSAVLQVTQPRSPCFKLAAHLGLPDFSKTFLASGRSGFYLSSACPLVRLSAWRDNCDCSVSQSFVSTCTSFLNPDP